MKANLLRCGLIFCLLSGLVWLSSFHQSDKAKEPKTIFIPENKARHGVDDLLFGHFLEKASWGKEIGGDVLIDSKTGVVIPSAGKLLHRLHIPVIRYPGGTDVDYYPWHNLIDNAPGRAESPRRPYTTRKGDHIVSDNRMGLDEFLALCEDLDCEPLLVVRAGDAYLGNIRIQDAVNDALNLVAYCNYMPDDTALSYEMSRWAQARIDNGRQQPFNVKYFEIGNEPWLFKGLSMKQEAADSAVQRYTEVIVAMTKAMKALDPEIKIITDGGIKGANELLRKRIGNQIDYVAYHPYQPWAIKKIEKGDSVISADQLTAEEIWNAWVATPDFDTQTGESSVVYDDYYINVSASGYQVAVTEWNWNGWWQLEDGQKAALNTKDAQGLGAAGFLHAFMRTGNINMGCQSMLAGISWGITSIRIDTTGVNPPELYPTGMATGFYARHHGNELLEMKSINVPHYRQPYRMNAIKAHEKVATIDALCTRGDGKLIFHAINRHFSEAIAISIDLSAFDPTGNYTFYCLKDKNPRQDDMYEAKPARGRIQGNMLTISLPARSISAIEIPLK